MQRIIWTLFIAGGMGACGNGSADNATSSDSTTNDERGSMYRNDSTTLNDTSHAVPDPTQPRDTVKKQ